MSRRFLLTTFLVSALTIQGVMLRAQSWGFAVGPRFMRTMYPSETRTNYPNLAPLNFIGLHAECLVEIGANRGFPVLSYAGFSTTFYAPNSDTTSIIAREHGSFSDDKIFVANVKRHYKCYSLMVAYEAPQKWSDFLTINYGGGLELAFAKTRYEIPEMDFSVYEMYREAGPLAPDWDNWDPMRQQTKLCLPRGNVFLGIFYEFEKFFINARYHLHISDSGFWGTHTAHSIYAGVYYPIHRF